MNSINAKLLYKQWFLEILEVALKYYDNQKGCVIDHLVISKKTYYVLIHEFLSTSIRKILLFYIKSMPADILVGI